MKSNPRFSSIPSRAFAIFSLLIATILAVPATAAEQGRGKALTGEQAREWRAVGRVNVGGLKSRGLCTGVLIAPDIVLTAAHCVVHQRTGKPHRLGSIHFVAGWLKGEMTGHSTAAALSIHPFYKPQRSEALGLTTDIALIRLVDPLSPEAAEPLEVAPPPKPGAPILVVSYRRDRQNALTYQDDCSLSYQEGPAMVLRCPVASGASGAPVLMETGGEKHVIGTLVARAGDGLAFAIQAKGAVENLLGSLDNPGAQQRAR